MWRSIRAEPDRPGFRVAVAERDGQLIGFGGAGPYHDAPPPRPRQLHFLYLLACGQGSGVGQALPDAVLGDEPASLWVLEGNARDIAFYASNRFTPDGTRQPTGFATGGDEIRMLR
jgi:GNAT superfamily N-acetyltransferase